jgi:hypothetical protein
MDGGKPVDASGEAFATDVPGRFVGLPGLVEKLAASAEVEACLVRQWLRFALPGGETAGDSCTVAHLTRVFRDSRHDARSVLAALVQTPAFVERRP